MTEQEKKSARAAAFISRDEMFLRRVLQEVIIHKDGSVEIAWINPAATPLVLEIWDAVNSKNSFPIRADKNGRIYCG